MIPATSVAQRNANTKGVMPTCDDAETVASLPMLGRWRINLDKSTTNGSRAGSDTFTWIFRAEGDRVRHDICDLPGRQAEPILRGEAEWIRGV